MPTYVIGDLQGCFSELQALLSLINFDARRDQLWFTGDLVNRGPESLECLRFVRSLGKGAVAVLGNHDIHLLAVYYAQQPKNETDTFEELLAAPDCGQLIEWLRFRPLIHMHGKDLLVHAGIPHIWSIEEAKLLAREAEAELRSAKFRNLLRVVYGDCPRLWRSPEAYGGEWKGVPRLRAIINYLVRMRVINQAGRCDFDYKGAGEPDQGTYRPWFEFWSETPARFLFGHWAALGAETGRGDIVALDGGCAWGYQLIAMRLEDGARFRVPARSPATGAAM